MMRDSRSRCIPGLVALTLAAAICGCNNQHERVAQPPNSREMTPVARLPAEFYGPWIFQGSSGGVDGQGNTAYRVEKIVIRDPNIIEEHRPGGTVTQDTFTPGRGRSIFSTDDVWQMQRKRASMIEVLALGTNGVLTISENAYDGFSYSFKRVESPQKRP